MARQQEDLDDELIEAFRQHDKEHIRKLIAAGANPNTSDSWENITPLMYAAKRGDEDLFKFLIEAKADIHARNKKDQNVLMFAAAGGNSNILKVCIDSGLDVNHKCKLGSIPLSHAAAYERDVAIKMLLAAGAEANKRVGDHNSTALIIAVQGGADRLNTVLALLEGGANPTLKDIYGNTPLCRSRVSEIRELILSFTERRKLLAACRNSNKEDQSTAASLGI